MYGWVRAAGGPSPKDMLNNSKILTYAREERTASAAHFTGPQKVMNVVSDKGTGAALYIARIYKKGTDKYNTRPEKQKLQQNNVGWKRALPQQRSKLNRMRKKDGNRALKNFTRGNT